MIKDLKVNLLSNKAVLPTRAHFTDAGFDITATDLCIEDDIFVYGTGVAIELPKGTAGLLMCRSSVYRKDLQLCNSVGLIDQDFRGELKFKFRATKPNPKLYNVGDKIGQLVIIDLPLITVSEVKELNKTIRGENGWGSSGR